MTITGFRPPSDTAAVIPLDASQAAVAGLGDAESALVVGAPGSGKTTTLIETVAERILDRGWRPAEVLALTSSRTTAARLRDRLGLRLAVTTTGPLARSVASLAFENVRHVFRDAGVAPRLITGGEQDGDIAALLAGQLDDGSGPNWPPHLGPEVRAVRAFRTELRELMMRATELGITPAELRRLGESGDRQEWVAAADFIDDYLGVVATSREHQFDSAELARFAVAALRRDEVSDTVRALRLVLVDDVHELTASGVELLGALAARGVAVIAFGDPDVATGAFRGGSAEVVGALGRRIGVPGLRTLVLERVYRHGPLLRGFTRAVTDRIGTAGVVGHRRAASGASGGSVVTVQAPTPARQWAAVAARLREQHLLHGVPWSAMAVIVRSGGQLPQAARALATAEVPTRTSVGASALRDDRAARCLLQVVAVAIGHRALDAEVATELLLGPVCGLDRLALRRLRLALRAEELAGGGSRHADDLVVEALAAPGRFASLDAAVARRADRLARLLAELAEHGARGASAEELLWQAWERSGLRSTWTREAQGSGVVAADAGRCLDGVVALFTAAKRFVEREPDAPPRVFLGRVLDAEVPEDTLSPRPLADTVLVTTPNGAVGLEFDIVVIGGLQDGVWPNLRLRGSLLHAAELVAPGGDPAAPATVIDARREVLSDELRMFALAVSRARRDVILAAVSNDDESPSPFFGLAPAESEAAESGQHAMTLRGLTGRLRRELTAAGRSPGSREHAAAALARLALEGVPGAHPDEWHGLKPPSTDERLFLDDEAVPVSPSKLQAFEDSPLDWFVESIAGSEPSTAMALGTVVHWAMETATGVALAEVWGAIESRWGELVFESEWVSEREKTVARRLAAGIAEYLADFERDGKTMVAAEGRFGMRIGRAAISGAIDRVERGLDGRVTIVDLKTGRPVTKQSEIDAHPQLGMYQLAYHDGSLDDALAAHGDHSAGGAKLLFVRDGVRGKSYREGVQAPFEADGLDELRRRIETAAELMAQATFEGAADPVGWGAQVASRRLQRVRPVSSD